MKIALSEKANEWKRENVCLLCKKGEGDLFFMDLAENAWGTFCKGCVVAIHSLTSPLSVLVNTGKDIYEDSTSPNEQKS